MEKKTLINPVAIQEGSEFLIEKFSLKEFEANFDA
jgi:hypothetical protein